MLRSSDIKYMRGACIFKLFLNFTAALLQRH